MQSKAIKYSLIAGVLFIWAIIIYKIAVASGDDDFKPRIIQAQLAAPQIVPDSFSLHADYPDPFIPENDTTADIAAGKENADAPIVQPPPPIEVEKVDLSFIQYFGMIENHSKHRKIAMVSIQGKELLAKEKEEIGSVIINRIEENTLSISYKGKQYKIRKNI